MSFHNSEYQLDQIEQSQSHPEHFTNPETEPSRAENQAGRTSPNIEPGSNTHPRRESSSRREPEHSPGNYIPSRGERLTVGLILIIVALLGGVLFITTHWQ